MTATEPLKVAAIGAGGIAQRNATETARSGAATIVGVLDVNMKAARDLAGKLKARVFASYDEVLGSPDVEAVLLSTPHDLHCEQTLAAARAGKHVLVEKPLATTLEDAERMIAACRTAGVQLAVNYSFRYLPKIQKAKELVREGALGDITGIQVIAHQFKDLGYWMGARSTSPDDWRSLKARSGGGFLMMNVCHTIDYLYFITGMRGTRVYAEYANLASPGDVEDIISVSCRWGDRAIGSICASSILRGADTAEERIWGTKGTLVINESGLSMYSTRPVDGKRPGRLHAYRTFPDVSWTAAWVRDFVTAVRTGTTPPVGAREAWENLAFLESAYASLTAGPVTIPECPQW
ncbi:MAG: Gfo/Idh/MocA family oxidoreductase [Acidobacteria bacterium]|nr:Gfo/Idh/MocA family oxidoreductase [Acidobacteriota bacterium]